MYIPATDEFDALAYGVQHPSTIQYAQEKLYQASQLVTDAGRRFVEAAKERFEYHSGSAAIRRAKALVRNAAHVFDRDDIKTIKTLAGLQTAKPKMQLLLMSEPTAREAYHQQRLDGYSDTYIDPFPGLIREQDPNYRRVMNGMVVDDEDGWHYTTYLDVAPAGEEELEALEFNEQTSVIKSWKLLEYYVKRGQDDPTSKVGGML